MKSVLPFKTYSLYSETPTKFVTLPGTAKKLISFEFKPVPDGDWILLSDLRDWAKRMRSYKETKKAFINYVEKEYSPKWELDWCEDEIVMINGTFIDSKGRERTHSFTDEFAAFWTARCELSRLAGCAKPLIKCDNADRITQQHRTAEFAIDKRELDS